MKLLFGLLLVVGGYYMALCHMTDSAIQQLAGIHHTYDSVTATADQWQQGNTSTSFADER